MSKQASSWVISIGGYGTFLFDGTETEAEEMRAHKARWERGIGKKRPATKGEVESGAPSQCLNHPGFGNRFVYADCLCPDEDCVADAHERMSPTKETP